MTDEITILSKRDAIWSEKPPFCFMLPLLFTVPLILAAVSDYKLFPLISVIVGAALGYPMGRLLAWANITYISANATELSKRPMVGFVAKIRRPVILIRSYAVQLLTSLAVIFVGTLVNMGLIYITSLVFPTVNKPWIPFDGVRLEDRLYTVFKPAVFIYACVVMWMVGISYYRWYHSLKDS